MKEEKRRDEEIKNEGNPAIKARDTAGKGGGESFGWTNPTNYAFSLREKRERRWPGSESRAHSVFRKGGTGKKHAAEGDSTQTGLLCCPRRGRKEKKGCGAHRRKGVCSSRKPGRLSQRRKEMEKKKGCAIEALSERERRSGKKEKATIAGLGVGGGLCLVHLFPLPSWLDRGKKKGGGMAVAAFGDE